MENFRIESLEISKIGAFEHIKMDFPVKKQEYAHLAEIHILTGENGTGKTTILESLTVICDEKPGKNTNTNNKFNKYKDGGETKFVTANNQLKAEYISKRRLELKGVEQEYGLAFFAYSGFRKINNVFLEGVKEIHELVLHDSMDFEKSTSPENQKIFFQWIANTIAKGLIAKGKGDISKSEYFRNSIIYIESAISAIIEKPILFEIDDNFNVLLKMDGLVLHFDVQSDGLKSLIIWLGDLLMRMDRLKWKSNLPIFERNFILFLDEIEVHLHPAWQRKILPVVQKLFKNAQIFISTHSPFVVGSVDGAWIHKLKKEGAFAVLDGEPVLSEDGKSVRRILDETFGINQQYGVDVEKDLQKFREFRQQVMMGYKYNSVEFNQLVKHIASQSPELEQMMGMEMNQLIRITQKELV
ncbi:MAG: AAA family ATPase [Arcicella sp.]|nr:AAA family ATPase [Arcicella sp.]